jgi:hypothetical protein
MMIKKKELPGWKQKRRLKLPVAAVVVVVEMLVVDPALVDKDEGLPVAVAEEVRAGEEDNNIHLLFGLLALFIKEWL